MERKASLIEAMGIDVLVVLPFTAAFSRVPAEDFVRDVLVGGIHAVHAAMGANFTFGFKAAGTVETLPAMGEPYGLTAEGVALFELDGRTVSSSSVRDALSAGDLAWPLAALGRRFVLDGEVTSGHGRGKGLGYPTANLRTWPRLLLPGQGIYAGVAEVDGLRYPAAIDVGTNPTFGVEPLHVEAFLLDFEGEELRGKPISIEFWERLRDEDQVRLGGGVDRGDRRRRPTHPRARRPFGLSYPSSVRSRRIASRAISSSGIVTPARCTSPLPGRVTPRANHASNPDPAAAATIVGRARSSRPGSRRSRAAKANNPIDEVSAPTTDAASWTSLIPDWPGAWPGSGWLDIRSRRNSPATTIATPDAPISAGPRPADALADPLADPLPPSRSSRAAANPTVAVPRARNPTVMTAGLSASGAARPLMCSWATEYPGWRTVPSAQAAVKAAGPISPHSASARCTLPFTAPS